MASKTLKFKSYHKISEVKEDPVRRITTGIPELDWIYGVTEKEVAGVHRSAWGLPEGKLSVWLASRGTGKSRALIEVAKKISTVKPTPLTRYTVLYFQGESPLNEFKSKVSSGGFSYDPEHFIVSDAKSLSEQIRIIRDLKRQRLGPQLIIIDSINMITDFEKGRESGVDAVILGTDDQIGYKDIAIEVGAHVIFVSQVTKAGDARGSSTFEHLVDQEFFVSKLKEDSSKFVITSPEKNRHAKTGIECVWQHFDDCVKCISNNRLSDKKWCDTHNSSFAAKNSRIRAAAQLTEQQVIEKNLKKAYAVKLQNRRKILNALSPDNRALMENMPKSQKKKWWEKLEEALEPYHFGIDGRDNGKTFTESIGELFDGLIVGTTAALMINSKKK